MKHKRWIAGFLSVLFILCTPLTVFASMNGIDVSSHQTGIEVDKLSGVDFVITKATEGTTYVNPDCDRVYQDAKRAGYSLGVYHYASGGDALAEAKHFVNNISGYIGEAILVLDFESYAVNQGVGWAKDWLDAVYNMTGVKPMIYMSNSVVHRYDWSSVKNAGYGLWNAAYYYGYNRINGFMSAPPIKGSITPWDKNTIIYQYTSSGRLNGWNGNLDLDIYYGNVSDWNRLAGKTSSGNYNPSDTPHTEDKIIYYTVQTGDTLSEIAQRYNTTYTAIANKNGIKNPNLIYVGQKLVISGSYESNTATSEKTHTVKSGECLSVIASKYGINWKTLAQINNINSPYIIYPNQKLTIPTTNTQTHTTTYTVKKNDCLYNIGLKFGVSWKTIASINGIKSPYIIYTGQVLRIA